MAINIKTLEASQHNYINHLWGMPNLSDVLAGLSLAGILLPESVAYAAIAGLPPIHALLGCLIGLSVYAIIGSSRQAIVSPTSSAAVIFTSAAAVSSDMGFALMQRSSTTAQQFGRVLVNSAPKILRVLAVVGTVAMFLVAGGIVVHDIPAIHHAVEPVIHLLGSTLTEALVGLVFGLILVSLTTAFNMIKRRFI